MRKFIAIFSVLLLLANFGTAQDSSLENDPVVFDSSLDSLSNEEKNQLLVDLFENGFETFGATKKCGGDQKQCRVGGQSWCCHQSKRCPTSSPPPFCVGAN